MIITDDRNPRTNHRIRAEFNSGPDHAIRPDVTELMRDEVGRNRTARRHVETAMNVTQSVPPATPAHQEPSGFVVDSRVRTQDVADAVHHRISFFRRSRSIIPS